MAKEVIPSRSRAAGARKPVEDAARSSGSRWRWPAAVLVVVAIAIAGAAVVRGWRRHELLVRVMQGVPAVPDLSSKSMVLRQRIEAAQAHLASSRAPLDSVAELARLYHVNGYPAEAGACWRLLHASEPREARWCYYLADARSATFDEEEAKQLLEETVRLAPDYVAAWLKLAELSFKQAHLEEALEAYRRVSELSSGDPYAALGLARIALQRGERKEGRRLIEESIRKVPEFPSSHNLYAEMLAQDGDATSAAKHRWLGTVAGRFHAAPDPWLEELRAWCFDATRLLVWGASELQTQNREAAEALFQKAIAVEEDDPRGYDSLGKLFLDAGQPARARDLFERACRLPAASERVFVNLSDAYVALGRPAEALNAADRGLAKVPNSPDLLNARGVALYSAGRLEEALEAYRGATEFGHNASPFTNLSLVLLRLGRKEEARVALQRALALQPMFPKALNLMGQLELEAGQVELAERYIRPYYEQYPGLPTAQQLMAKWYLQSALKSARAGDPASAERACRDGLAADPGATDIYGFLSVLYTQQGRKAEALDSLETARKLKPADAHVAMALAALYVQLGRSPEARRLLIESEENARRQGNAELADRYDALVKRLRE